MCDARFALMVVLGGRRRCGQDVRDTVYTFASIAPQPFFTQCLRYESISVYARLSRAVTDYADVSSVSNGNKPVTALIVRSIVSACSRSC